MTIQKGEATIQTPTGPMRSVLFRPNRKGRFPTLVLYSEIFQVTAPIARTAAFYAGHGYVVIVPEVFHELNPLGTVLAYDEEGKEKGNSDKFSKPLTSHDSDLAAILAWTEQQDYCEGSVGCIGMCLGGHLAIRAALHPRVVAASCLYATDLHSSTIPAGDSAQTLNRLSEIQGEVLFVWGRQDPHVPFEGRALIYQRCHEADFSYEWHEMNAAHAFLRDEGERYDPALAALTQQLSLGLFTRSFI